MKPETEFVVELLKAGAFLARVGGRITAGYGLSQQQFVILKVVEEAGQISQREIRSNLLYDKSNVSKAVGILVRKGLATIDRSPEDARVQVVEATDKGREIVGQCMKDFERWNRQWVRGTDSKGLVAATRLLRSLAAGSEE